MTAATALIAGNEPLPELAAEAVSQALASAGLSHANGILLFLTAEFAHTAAAAVHAAARAGNCLHIAGGIVGGVANERRWVVDRPAAAVMVLGDRHSLGPEDVTAGNLLCIAADISLPSCWRDAADRCGLLFQDPLIAQAFPAWQQGRLMPEHRACVGIVGATRHTAVSTGLRQLGPRRRVDSAHGHDLARLDGMTALAALRRELPAEYRAAPPAADRGLPLHGLYAMLGDEGDPGLPRILPILAANGDESLTLGDRVRPGDRLAFAIRQPIDAERELQCRLGELAAACPTPSFGLFLSCIGRGPYFYAGEDRDWQLFRERFPQMPFLGAYGSSQIAPLPEPRVVQNCVVLNVFADAPAAENA